MAGSCIFCRGTFGPGRQRSLEHVFALWIQRALNGDRFAHYIKDGDGTPRHTWTTKRPDIVTKTVCRPCNNTWLSVIETRAQPYLTTMIQGRGREFDPSGDSARYVACWAHKTTLTLSAADKDVRIVPDEDFAELYATRDVLPNVHVWAGMCNETDSASGQCRSLESGPRSEAAKGYHATIRVGHLVLHVMRMKLDGWESIEIEGLAGKVLLPIWPITTKTLWPPPGKLTPDGVDQLSSLIVRVGRPRPATSS